MFNEKELAYLNAIKKIYGFGPQKIRLLLDFFGSAENAWTADIGNLIQSRIGEPLAQKLVENRQAIDPEAEWRKLQKENIRIITIEDERYPRLLKEIPQAPFLIYIKSHSDFDLNSAPIISVVGSRKFTAYGEQAAESMVKDLARAGITVVSGMAIGIDSLAHRAALDAGGKTLAVLGNSLDDKNIYPVCNFGLSREIMESGALISDYPVETKAADFTFPARNRIVAGLSLGTLIIEAGKKSGTLITARLALDYGREVFAVPGSIFSEQSAGVHDLLKAGAKPVASVKDILEELDLQSAPTKANKPQTKTAIALTPEEERIVKFLSNEPLQIDRIIKLTKMDTSAVSSALVMLEIKGAAKNIGGQNYIII